MNRRLENVVAIAVCALLAGCSGKEARIESHLEKGSAFFAQSDPDKAMVEIHNVLQMDPKRPEAYYLGGQIEESRSELRNAYANFSKALEIKPDYYDAQAGLARLNLTIGNNAEAQKLTDAVLAKDPKNIQAIAVAAALKARSGDVDGAIKLVSDNSPGDRLPPSTASVLAGLYSSRGEFAKAEPIIQSSLSASPNDLSLLLIDADLNRRLNQPEKAISDYQKAAADAPKNFRVWQAWATFQDQAGHPDAAEQVLKDSIKAAPDDSSRKLALITMIGRHQGEAAGVNQLQAMHEDHPKDYVLGFALADYYAGKSQIASAREVLEKIVHADGRGTSGLRARNQLASFDLATGDVAHARASAEDILKIDPRDSAALQLRGRIELSEHQVDSAIADFRAAARDKPDSVPVLSLLAKAYIEKKQPDLAADTLSDATKLFPNRPEIALLQMQFLESQGRSTDAVSVAVDSMRRNPNNFDLVRAKAAAEEKQKDASSAEATFTAWLSGHTNDALSMVLLGQLYQREKKLDLALAQFAHASVLSPNSAEPLSAALQVLVAEKRYPDADKLVSDAIAKAPKAAVNYQLRGDVLLAKGDNAGAETAYRQAIQLQPTAVTAYLNLANFLAAQKRPDEVKATFDAGLNANPKNTLLEAAYSDFLTKSGQYDAAIALYDRMLVEVPSNAIAANNLAFILSDIKGDRSSLDRAVALTKGFEYSTDPTFLDTLAWTDYKLGRYDEAVAIFQRAAALAPSSSALQVRYGMALYKSGALAAAKEHLTLASKQGGALPDDAKQMLAKS